MKLSIGSLINSDDSGLVRALCAYQGSFVSMDGIPITFTSANMSHFVEATNKYLQFGVKVPLFESEHEATQRTKVGLVEGEFEIRTIEEEDLPDPVMRDILGLPGIFARVRLATKEAIARFEAGLLRPISIGVDAFGYQFPAGTIYELSGVGVSAIPGAQLYLGVGDMDFKADSIKAIALSKDPNSVEAQTTELQGLLNGLVRLAKGDDPKELEKAIDGLVVGLSSSSRKLVTEVSAEQETDQTEQTEQSEEEDLLDSSQAAMPELVKLRAQVSQMSKRLAENEVETQLTRLYFSVKQKANELVELGYLPPTALESFLCDSDEPKALVLRFGTAKGGMSSAIAELTKKMTKLEGMEEFGVPVRMGLMADELPLDPTVRQEAKNFFESRSIKQPSYR